MLAKSGVKVKRGHRDALLNRKDQTMTTIDGKIYRIQVPDNVLSPNSSGIVAEVKRGPQAMNFDIKADGSVAIRE